MEEEDISKEENPKEENPEVPPEVSEEPETPEEPDIPEESSVPMGDSILRSVKKLLAIPDVDTSFDLDISIHINTVFMTLNQLGVGPNLSFSIADANATWSDFFDDRIDLNGVKTYIYLKVRILFDPPTSSAVLDAYNKEIAELEWRLNLNAESEESEEGKNE